ncbi:MAG: phosphoribosylformylglycinamidine synthase II [Thermoplasmatales archaeon B_DKE]|nr:MAG: phosphoribosylformylglycinamidine synthase II [Thermoplasmatales archaeon B_DKE]
MPGKTKKAAKPETVKLIETPNADLGKLSGDLSLSLSTDEMIMLKHYFTDLGRNPTMLETEAMAQAWSEHCCYKSSKLYLKKFLSGLKTDYTILAMEDDAGVIEFDNTHAYVVKMESHNHPSAIEPYGGAATGVGGIIRDVLCMGAQPVALMDSIYLGDIRENSKNDHGLTQRFTFNGIVNGIRDYGNRVGIPNVAGSVDFDKSYGNNPLVNAGCIGIARKDHIIRSKIEKVDDLLIIAGGRTGRDGIHGVNFASVRISERESNKRAVQLGNPIIKEPLIHAILEAVEHGLIDGMKDLGGGGMSSSVGEMCYAGGTSAEIHLENVLLKEADMEPWEIWISESQERMLVAVSRENIEEISDIFRKWDIEFSIIGTVKPGNNLVIYYKDRKEMDLSLPFLTSGPMYCRPYRSKIIDRKETRLPKEPQNFSEFVLKFAADPNVCSRFRVIRQYDFTVRGNTISKPLTGFPNHETHSDCAIIKPLEESMKGLALSIGTAPRIVSLNPYQGTLAALSEGFRNILVSGSRPHSIVDSLNFGDPEAPDSMGEFVESVRALGDFCRKFNLPVVAGNVSLYNGSSTSSIIPTPTMMFTGICDDVSRTLSSDFKSDGNLVILVGSSPPDLSGSLYSLYSGVESYNAPSIDLDELVRISSGFMRAFELGLIISAHDVSGGGIVMAAAEMSFGRGVGLSMDLTDVSNGRTAQKMFSEAGNRILVEIPEENFQEFSKCFDDVKIVKIGKTGGDRLRIDDVNLNYVDLGIEELRDTWDHGLDDYI